MALLAPQVASTGAGTAITFAAASGGGDTLPFASVNQMLIVRNASGSPITVTVVAPGNNEDGLANPDPTTSVAATTGVSAIKFAQRHVDPSTGLISVTYSGVTSLTVALVA